MTAVADTASAAYHYAKHTKIDWRVAGRPQMGLYSDGTKQTRNRMLTA